METYDAKLASMSADAALVTELARETSGEFEAKREVRGLRGACQQLHPALLRHTLPKEMCPCHGGFVLGASVAATNPLAHTHALWFRALGCRLQGICTS